MTERRWRLPLYLVQDAIDIQHSALRGEISPDDPAVREAGQIINRWIDSLPKERVRAMAEKATADLTPAERFGIWNMMQKGEL